MRINVKKYIFYLIKFIFKFSFFINLILSVNYRDLLFYSFYIKMYLF